MELTEDELKALEMLRIGKASLAQSWLLADTLTRLFPVRTYGNLVIRWSDPITPERLVACGWVYSGVNPALVVYNEMIVFHRWDKTWRVMSEWLLNATKPRNMLEVWNLMERCGIKEGGE